MFDYDSLIDQRNFEAFLYGGPEPKTPRDMQRWRQSLNEKIQQDRNNVKPGPENPEVTATFDNDGEIFIKTIGSKISDHIQKKK